MDAHKSLAQVAYEQLKRKLLSGMLLPDSLVDEAQIAAEIGASKTPVRQAMGRLSSEGFIRVLPQRGSLVNRISLVDMQHVYLLRELIEPEANQLAAKRATTQQVATLQDLDERLETSEEITAHLFLHTEFHVAVARIAGIPRLTRIVAELQEQMQWFLTVRAAEGGELPARHHHRELVTAIGNGDGSEARRITEYTIRKSREDLLRGVISAGA